MKKYQKPAILLGFFLFILIPSLRSAAFCGLLALCAGRLAAVPLEWMEERGCPRWLGGIFLMMGCSLAALLLLFQLISRLCSAISSIVQKIPDFSALFQSLSNSASDMEGGFGIVVKDLLLLLSQQSERLPELIASAAGNVSKEAASALPGKLLFFFITIFASYYAAVDWPQLRKLVNRAVPADWEQQMQRLLHALAMGGKNWLRVQGRLILIQLLLLSTGFALLKVANPLFAGLMTALTDALPLLGTGTILLPWALFLLLTGETQAALGMSVLWFCSWVVRTVLEPRLVGHQAGISPFFTIVGMYLGFRCFGISGMIASAVLFSAAGCMIHPS